MIKHCAECGYEVNVRADGTITDANQRPVDACPRCGLDWFGVAGLEDNPPKEVGVPSRIIGQEKNND